MDNKKSIYCPICKRKVATWDGKSTIPILVNCGKCKKRIVFDMETGETKAREIPPRVSSSAKTFY